MPTSVELRQQRARVVERLREITDRAESEDRNLDGTEREEFDRLDGEFRTFGERIDRQEALEAREADNAQPLDRAAGAGGNAAGGGDQATRETAAFMRFLRGGRSALDPQQRALVENTAGEILVPEALEAEIMRELPEITIMRGMASTRQIATNRVRRRSLDEVSVGWGRLETSDQSLSDSMPGTPTEEYTYIEDQYGLAKIGEDEFDDSDVNLEAFVRDSFSRALGESQDTAFTVGTGHSNHQPVGFMTSGGGVSSVTGGSTDYSGAGETLVDDLKRLIYAVPPQYRRNGQFVTASSTELIVAQAKDSNGNYLWQPSVQAGRPNTFLGYPLRNQEDVAAVAAATNVAAFGDFNAGYRIYDRQGMTVQRLVELYAEDGMIGFKVRARVAGDVVRPQALRILTTAAA